MKNYINTAQLDLMKMHIDALFVLDANFDLCTVNEPWDKSAPACRFFLGRTMDGRYVSKFRHDVGRKIRDGINELCKTEPMPGCGAKEPKHLKAYLDMLGAKDYTVSLCYCVPPLARRENGCVMIDKSNLTSLGASGFEWLADEIDSAQPCAGVALSNQIVSVCRSVRISAKAHEAGVETAEASRGNGYALDTLTNWSEAVRGLGAVPLYSALVGNTASRRIAQKAGLYRYGVGFSVF